MNYSQRETSADEYDSDYDERRYTTPPRRVSRSAPPVVRSASPIAVGAKTVAGIGIGLLTVVGGAAILGIAAETVLIPSLLLKLAGGIAGGGVGMAKGLKDVPPPRVEE